MVSSTYTQDINVLIFENVLTISTHICRSFLKSDCAEKNCILKYFFPGH